MHPAQQSWFRKFDFALIRVIVPLWILTGAVFKLWEFTPTTLPKTIRETAHDLGVDLYVLLPTLIGLEFLAIAVLMFVKPLARVMAFFMLTVFCMILIGEIAIGNTSCGCLGSASPSPKVMLGIDGALLLGVIVTSIFTWRSGAETATATTSTTRASSDRWPYGAAGALTVLGFALSFGVMAWDAQQVRGSGPANGPDVAKKPDADSDDEGGDIDQSDDAASDAGGGDSGASGTQAGLQQPRYWMTSGDEPQSWEGKSWRAAELFLYMNPRPSILNQGVHYVVFYKRNCDHCEEMFYNELSNPEVASKTIAVEVPYSKSQMRPESGTWHMPRTECMMMELPIGTDWIITTPLALRVEDGIITCAREGEHAPCFK